MAPSPDQATATRGCCRSWNVSADGDRHHRRQVADHRDQAQPDVGHVDVAVLPCGEAVGAAHVLGEDAPRRRAPRHVNAHVALDRRADIVGLHGGCDSHRGAFVASPRVKTARDLSLAVEDVAALLDPPRDQHVAVDLEQVLAIEVGGANILGGLDWRGFSRYCHPCSQCSG
jgi:hypothetical protein